MDRFYRTLTVTFSIFLGACATLPASEQPVARRPDGQASRAPTPESVIGHPVAADYKLARWEKIVAYFDQLEAASDRLVVERIGTSTEGNPFILAVISDAETIRRRDYYKSLQARLADPRLITDAADRQRTLTEAKTTIIVTCSLHSSEVAASQMSMELAHALVTGNDPRTREIVDNCIILLVPSANPDGNNKIVDWYERNLGTPFEGGRMPWLYQKYAGHDNNRDWFMLNLEETRVLTRVMYHDWHPTISYDIHQMGSTGPRFFVPPFFDPVNPNVDPLIHQSLLIIGGHMATELQERHKSGVVFKAIFDNWWQGGNRTTPYRHNVVGILTEAASVKYASPIFLEHARLRAGGRGFPVYAPAVNFPEPWPGGWWRLRDIADYELIACDALFTLGARYRDRFVRNHLALSEKALKLGRDEPPFAWLVPPDQRDPGAAAHMLEILRLGGIEIHEADAPFTADGATYPAGTRVLLAAQPYRPHLKDMMERQEYPERRVTPDGPAEPPYDAAGWTLPLQMGVKTIPVVAAFDAPLRMLDSIEPPSANAPPDAHPAAWATRRHGNADYAVVNDLLAEGFSAYVLASAYHDWPPGTIVFPATERANELQKRIASPDAPAARPSGVVPAERFARFDPIGDLPRDLDPRLFQPMTQPRTALYQPWTASMDEGWTRYVLEQFHFGYTTIHNADIRAGDLRARFDCIIMPDQSQRSILDGVSDKSMPPPYAGGIGLDGAMHLERFVQEGGTLVLLDSATTLATDVFRVPVRDVLAGLPGDTFFCPGSLLRVRIDNSHPLGYGFADEAAAYFARSHAFVTGKDALQPQSATPSRGLQSARTSARNECRGSGSQPANANAPAAPATLSDDEIKTKLAAQPTTTVARYADNIILLSGWILGQDHLRNKAAVCEVGYGRGRIVLLGFRVQHRAQPHGTFRFLFNAIYRSTLP